MNSLSIARRIMSLLGLSLAFSYSSFADDSTIPVRIIPASAPTMVLEAVNSGATDGAVVSINNPADALNQQWIFTPKGDGFFSIRPKHTSNLVLSVAHGGTSSGTPIVLETDKGEPSQLWRIRKNENNTISLMPKHALLKALDDFKGGKAVGSKQDLWDYNPADPHVQWTLQALTGERLPSVLESSPASQTTAPLTGGSTAPALGVPEGVIRDFQFTTSVIFPGTTRKVSVFIPAQYDGSKPACVYVRQDGYDAKEKPLLEAMIAAKQMPVTIGVFVKPGTLLAPSKEQIARRNRDFEYDGVGDNYARFITEEILPYVSKEFGLKLSNDPNDRCIAGASSGGISAFNAAWERPDLFRRVYAGSGSFVAFRGGHEFPTLIRKFEAKPIRAYLTTATQDMVNCAGDWYLLDQEMDKALQFSGYDYFFRSVEGKHCAGFNNYFGEAMQFIWKDWPEPVRAGASAPRVRDVIQPGEDWQVAAEGFVDARGPACNASGEVFFVDPPSNKGYQIGRDGQVSVFRADMRHANSLTVGTGGELYAVSSSTGEVMSYGMAGAANLVLSGVYGRYILALPNGALYVSGPGEKPDDADRVWLVQKGHATLVDSGIKHATGLAYRPDQWLLSVADGASKWVYSYQITPEGTLINKERFFCLYVQDWEDNAGPESVCYAREGQMLVATRAGIQICADDGPTQVILPLPDRKRVTGVCLGGPEMDTLYAFTGNKIWKRKVKIHATGAFSPIAKLKATPL